MEHAMSNTFPPRLGRMMSIQELIQILPPLTPPASGRGIRSEALPVTRGMRIETVDRAVETHVLHAIQDDWAFIK
jgi:hypothetical protein